MLYNKNKLMWIFLDYNELKYWFEANPVCFVNATPSQRYKLNWKLNCNGLIQLTVQIFVNKNKYYSLSGYSKECVGVGGWSKGRESVSYSCSRSVPLINASSASSRISRSEVQQQQRILDQELCRSTYCRVNDGRSEPGSVLAPSPRAAQLTVKSCGNVSGPTVLWGLQLLR